MHKNTSNSIFGVRLKWTLNYFVAYLVTSTLLLVLSASLQAKELYVSPEGNDLADGTLDDPFATLERARDEIRFLRSIGDEVPGASILLRGGTYELRETFALNGLDSGTAETPVIYRNYENEEVRLIGGEKLDPSVFSKITDEKLLSGLSEEARLNIVGVNLRELGIVDYGQFEQYGHVKVTPAPLELFLNGEPMQVARYPNEGFIQIGKVIDPGSVPRGSDYSERGALFKYTDPRHEQWVGLEDIWIQGTLGNGWSDDNVAIERIDPVLGTVKLATPSVYGVNSGKDYLQYYIYNVFKELNAPGEYYLDRASGILHFWPPADLEDSDILVSLLEDPIIAMEGCDYIVFEGITIEAGRGIGVYLERASHNTIAGCVIRNMGTTGIVIGMGAKQTFPHLTHSDYEGVPVSRRVGHYQLQMYKETGWDRYPGVKNRIVSCDIYNTGSGGVMLGGGSKRELIRGGSEVVNCKIYDFNRRNQFLTAGINVDGCGNRVAHNDISKSLFQAIYVRGNEHVFEYNFIHEIAKDSDDTSAWYLGRDPSDRGNIIRYNFFYDVGRADRSVMGVYCDDATTDVAVLSNIFYKVGGGRATVFSNAGQDLLVDNNIFIECGAAVEISSFFYTWGSKTSQVNPPYKDYEEGYIFYYLRDAYRKRLTESIDFRAPPYSVEYPELTDWLNPIPEPGAENEYIGIRPRRNLMVNNVVYNSKELIIYRGDYAQFETVDNFVTNENPGFVDIANLDLRLKEDSIVFDKIPDFEPIPFREIGLFSDQYRKVE